MIAYIDIEANGLLEAATKVHCIAVSYDGQAPVLYPTSELAVALKEIDACNVVVGHNLIAYDLEVLYRLHGWMPKAKVVDTLTLAQMVAPDILGGNGLAAWGERIGCPKTDYQAAYVEWRITQGPEYKYSEGDEWAEYNGVMGEYNKQDVRVLVKLYAHLLSLMYKASCDWEQAEKLEHAFAKLFAEQGRHGVYIDKPHVEDCIARWTAECESIAAEVEPLLPSKPMNQGEFEAARPPKIQFRRNGDVSALMARWIEANDYKGPLPAPAPTHIAMRLNNTPAIKGWLMDQGWVPVHWAFKKEKDKSGKMRIVRGDDGQPVPTQPKIHSGGVLCPNLEALEGFSETARLVARWMIVKHRLGFMKSIVAHLRQDGTVPATGMALGTPTTRVRHVAPVANVPKAEASVLYGKECRAAFTARPGRVLVGVDASGLELRCLANRVGSKALIDTIVSGAKEEGTDFYTRNGKLLGCDRATAKTITLGWLYGAGDDKLGSTLGGGKQRGAAARAALINGTPGLPELMEKVAAAAVRGYITALDGRRIEIRSKHSALNTLLQSDGSILIKAATCYAHAKIKRLGLDVMQVMHIHDEVQYDCSLEDSDKAGPIFVEGLKWAAHRFKFKCPMDGAWDKARDWSGTH